jgi:glycosyltransferase involved in cell wall biosynthesis
MTMASISVVIPVLDDSAHLTECLRALAAQTRQADEILVVDNGSADDSAAVARSFGARVLHEPVRGIAPANATGFDAAQGEIIARLDADSIAAPDWLERIEAAFDADAGLAALTGSAVFRDGSPLVNWIGREVYLRWYFWAMGGLLGHPPLFGSNLALRSAVWHEVRDDVHRSDPRMHDDLDLSFQIAPGMRVVRDDSLGMTVSSRPFASARSFALRSWRGVVTLAVNRGARRRHAATSARLLPMARPRG